jgi:hypothetical protein
MRKTKEIVINDRGTNKSFKITEMSASKFEWWLIRVGRLLLGTGIGNQVDVDSAEDVQKLIADTLIKDGLKSLGSVNLAEAKELYDDLLRCCELKSDNFYMPLDTDTIDGQIESVKTLFTLRKEALMLHLDFLESAAQSQSATAAKSATSIIRPLKQKTSAR